MHQIVLASRKENSVSEDSIMHLSSHSMMAVREHHEINQAIRHLSRKVWLMATIAVCLILISGAAFRCLYFTVKQHQQESRNVGAR